MSRAIQKRAQPEPAKSPRGATASSKPHAPHPPWSPARRPDGEAAPRPNRTGLPDRLKAGAEALSGVSLDDVRVHRNSAEPAKVAALAYAAGTDIHLGPGQHQHLPHEAWHVVQQMQGRVPATARLEDGTTLNDDSALEREADRMGHAALAAPAGRAPPLLSGRPAGVVQRTINEEPDIWLGEHATAAALRDQCVKPFLDSTNTSSGKSVRDETLDALWVLHPNQGEEHRVTQWRGRLYSALKALDPFTGAKADAVRDTAELKLYANKILAAGSVTNAQAIAAQWKLTAAKLVPGTGVAVQWAGAAMVAMVSLPPVGNDPRPTPKRLKISLQRHMYSLLLSTSTTEDLNTMLLPSVSEADVQKDMAYIGERYLALMQAKKTGDVKVSREDTRTYVLEHLTQEEPHIFPSGGAQTNTLSRAEHEGIKILKGPAKPTSEGQWDAYAAARPKDSRAGLLTKMAELKVAKEDRDGYAAALARLEPPPKRK